MEETLQVKIKRVSRSKALRIAVKNSGEVVVTAPVFVLQSKIEQFIQENREWIEEKRTLLSRRQSLLTKSYRYLLYKGRKYRFHLQISGKERVRLIDDKIIVDAPVENHQQVRQILVNWYKKQSRNYFCQRVPLLADLLDLDINKVAIRSQSTRWGSCSSSRTISLNWRLIMAKPWISDYVIFHELTHLIHMNHSPKFWETVERFFPQYRKAEDWLKANHRLLEF